MVRSEARKKYPKLVELLKDNHNTIEDGESYDSFRQRIQKIFRELIESDFPVAGVITHGGPIRLIFREVLKLGEINVSDCAWVELKLENDQLELLGRKGIEIIGES